MSATKTSSSLVRTYDVNHGSKQYVLVMSNISCSMAKWSSTAGLGDLTKEETRAIKLSIEAIKKGSNQERLSQVSLEHARIFLTCV